MIDITNVINAIALLIVAVASTYIGYLQKKSKNQQNLSEWVTIAVSAAEQMYKQNMTNDRKAEVVKMLNAHGFTADTEAVDTMIEAAVNKLPKAERNINNETMRGGKGD